MEAHTGVSWDNPAGNKNPLKSTESIFFLHTASKRYKQGIRLFSALILGFLESQEAIPQTADTYMTQALFLVTYAAAGLSLVD